MRRIAAVLTLVVLAAVWSAAAPAVENTKALTASGGVLIGLLGGGRVASPARGLRSGAGAPIDPS